MKDLNYLDYLIELKEKGDVNMLYKLATKFFCQNLILLEYLEGVEEDDIC